MESNTGCNLVVKGFPPETNEAILTAYLESITHNGAVQKVKLKRDIFDPTLAKFAFVCF